MRTVTIDGLVAGCWLVMLWAAPGVTYAHGNGATTRFTPAAETEPLSGVLRGCVERTDPDQTQRLSGLGDDAYPLVTLGAAAGQVRLFYSQGVTLVYGFNFAEAIHAFHKAASLDASVAMPYWGIALAASSNINSAATNGCHRLAYHAAQLALKHARQRRGDAAAQAGHTPAQLQREVDYAEAIQTLYQRVDANTVTVSGATRRSYVEAMERLSKISTPPRCTRTPC
jgi:hypothetical protein